MQPNVKYITINDNLQKIEKLLNELVLAPRLKALEWSAITDQTPNLKIGYPGQHLASLITGMKGVKTGARGNDIIDGTEVKSCSRVDASDQCRDCKAKILRLEDVCPNCGSTNIVRDNTSKWLFTIRSEDDLTVLCTDVQRVLLILADYPEFDKHNFNIIQFKAYEIWTTSKRCARFMELMTNYYENIYLEHKKRNATKTPAPKNFWPYSYQFYLCNPIKTFQCTIKDANVKPIVSIDYYVSPSIDRNSLLSELMPSLLLDKEELLLLADSSNKDLVSLKFSNMKQYEDFVSAVSENKMKKAYQLLPYIDEDLRSLLSIRPDKSFDIKTKHQRKKL